MGAPSYYTQRATVGASYAGRFAPSPTGPLHAGSLVAALASWLDARAHGGRWLVRIEDVDGPRCVAGADQRILQQLADCGLLPDAPPVFQSQRGTFYQQALDRLTSTGFAYPCGCTRQDIAEALAARGQPRQRNAELIYPGTCRSGLNGQPARAWRLFSDKFQSNKADVQVQRSQLAIDNIAKIHSPGQQLTTWFDRRLGPQQQDVPREVGDFVLRRADGIWAYQLAVVVDDAAQGITHVVRGEDLADNTGRQIVLQRALALPLPQYLHVPLVRGADGQKLSKQNGAKALDVSTPAAALDALKVAGRTLGLDASTSEVRDWLSIVLNQWAQRYHDCGYGPAR